MSTTQTPTGCVTTVKMVLASGLDVPTQINLADGSLVKPASDGSITVDAKHIPSLLQLGWQIAIGSGATHVP